MSASPVVPPAPLPVDARRGWVRPVQVVAIFIGWLSVVVAADLLHPFGGVRSVALFGHLVCLAVSFGAVLAVEVHGLALLLRLTSVDRVVHLAAALDPLIWAGLVGLGATGVLLGPHLDRAVVIIKLLAVLTVALNGLWARDLVRELRMLPGERTRLPRRLVLRAARLSAVSQLGWWAAVTIGFVTTNG